MNGPCRILLPLLLCLAPVWASAQPAAQEKEIRETIEQLVLINGKKAPDPRETLDKVRKGEVTIEETLLPAIPT